MNDNTLLTANQIDLIKQTWSKVVPFADTASEAFYYRLFEINPALRPLFYGTDLPGQRKKLVKAINLVVMSLDRIESQVPNLQALGKRHLSYGVTDDHYDQVGEALLWTLETGLKGDWTEAAREAWTGAYQIIAGAMIEGASIARSENASGEHRHLDHRHVEAAGIESERKIA